MKISKLFHWLYASVMMLPLVVAPIFAIYSHRHNVTQDTIIVTQEPIYFDTNEVSSVNDLIVGNIYSFNITTDNVYPNYFAVVCDDIFYDGFITSSITVPNSYATPYFCRYSMNSYAIELHFDDLVLRTDSIGIIDFVYRANAVNLSGVLDYISICNTQRIKGYTDITTTYTNDVGTSFIDNVYVTLDKYFNVTNFVGLNNLYSWINTNVFSGSAPLGFNIFYMLLSYWLLVSIFWLVFDVVMYVPNLAHRWLDKGSLQ